MVSGNKNKNIFISSFWIEPQDIWAIYDVKEISKKLLTFFVFSLLAIASSVLQFTTSDYPLRYLQCFPIWKKTLRNCRFLFTVYIATLSCLIYKYNNTTWFISLKSLIYINCQAPSRISTCIANIKRLIQRSTFSWEKNTTLQYSLNDRLKDAKNNSSSQTSFLVMLDTNKKCKVDIYLKQNKK